MYGIDKKTIENLKKFYRLIIPNDLGDDEYVRIVGIHRNNHAIVEHSVQSVDDFISKVTHYRASHNLFMSLATHHGTKRRTNVVRNLIISHSS